MTDLGTPPLLAPQQIAEMMSAAFAEPLDAAALEIGVPIDGAVNRTFPIAVRGRRYALRLRREETYFRYEKGVAKSALVASIHAAKRAGGSDAAAGAADPAKSSATPPFSPVLRYWSNGDALWPLPWEVTDWCAGVTLARAAAPAAIERAGRAIAAIHAVRFDGGYTDLLSLGEPPMAFGEWLGAAMARELARGRIDARLARFAERAVHAAPAQTDWTLAHNDLHGLHLIDDAAAGTLHIIDWDNAVVAPPELDFVKLRYWTRIDPASGKLAADPAIYRDVLAAYRQAGGKTPDETVQRACETLWLLRVFHFEADRVAAGKPTPALFPAAGIYLRALEELAGSA